MLHGDGVAARRCRRTRGQPDSRAGPAGVSHPGNHVNPLLGNLLAQLGWLNLVLAIFNLLPGCRWMVA